MNPYVNDMGGLRLTGNSQILKANHEILKGRIKSQRNHQNAYGEIASKKTIFVYLIFGFYGPGYNSFAANSKQKTKLVCLNLCFYGFGYHAFAVKS